MHYSSCVLEWRVWNLSECHILMCACTLGGVTVTLKHGCQNSSSYLLATRLCLLYQWYMNIKGIHGVFCICMSNEPYPLNTFNLTLNKPILLTHTNIRDKYWRAFTYILYSTVKSSCITKGKVKQRSSLRNTLYINHSIKYSYLLFSKVYRVIVA